MFFGYKVFFFGHFFATIYGPKQPYSRHRNALFWDNPEDRVVLQRACLRALAAGVLTTSQKVDRLELKIPVRWKNHSSAHQPVCRRALPYSPGILAGPKRNLYVTFFSEIWSFRLYGQFLSGPEVEHISGTKCIFSGPKFWCQYYFLGFVQKHISIPNLLQFWVATISF